jgi:CheY-like chemotaxis protein
MEKLLDALLDISKLDAGVLTPQVADFAINPLLARMETAFAAAAQAKGLRLRVLPTRLIVRSDPVLLERIVMNLVSNAVRYTERGGIVVGCRRRGGQARIEVWDSGVGIPADKRAEIFQEFYQLANPGRDRSKGLGLGLAIVERLARLLGHRIELASTPGQGSVFAIELPRGEARTVAGASQVPAGAIIAGAYVVVVDDEALVRDGMQGLLTGWGCHVMTAASGDEALARLAGHERIPDAIVSDYRLGDGETGVHVIERLRAESGMEIPAVLISGDTTPELLRAAKAGGYHLLHKPVPPAKLRAMLSYLLTDAKRAARG